MLDYPKSTAEHQWGREFLAARGAATISPDAHLLYWTLGGAPVWVVAFDSWLGKTCQLHTATNKARLVPRTFATAVFHYAFVIQKREMIFAMVNSKNKAAMRLDLWLGFTPMLTIPKMHDDGGDIEALFMRKNKCRWLKGQNEQIDSSRS